VAVDCIHPLGQGRPGFVELRHVCALEEDLPRAGLVALLVRVLNVAAEFPIALERAAEPVVAELVKGSFERLLEGVPEKCRVCA